MTKSTYVECPFCDGLMEIDLETGHVIKKWAKEEKGAPGEDKMAFSLKKLGEARKKRGSLFDKTKDELAEQKKKSQENFLKEVEKIKKEGLKEKPQNPLDLD